MKILSLAHEGIFVFFAVYSGCAVVLSPRFLLCLRLLAQAYESLSGTIDFHGIDTFYYTIEHHAPADDEEWGTGYC